MGRRSGPTVGSRHAGLEAGGVSSARFVLDGRVGLFDFLFGLVAGTGACAGTDRGADHGARRSGDRTADEGAGSSAAQRAAAGPGLVVAFGRLTRDRAGDGTDATTDHGPDRATDGHADGRAAEGAGTGADGLAACSSFSGAVPEPSPGSVASSGSSCCRLRPSIGSFVYVVVVAVHVGLLVVWGPAHPPGR